MSDGVERVEAEVIEPPRALGEFDRWLAEQEATIAAARGDWHAHDIESAEDYRESKRQRASLRRLVKQVEDGRRAMTAALDEALAEVRDRTRAALADLAAEDEAYRAALGAWEGAVVQDRMTELAARYADEYPDLVAQVPFAKLSERFAGPGKWCNYGTRTEAAWASVRDASDEVAHEVATLMALDCDEGERVDLMADYFAGLDLSSAVARATARRKRRESVRAAREAAEAYAAAPAPDAAPDGQPAPDREPVAVVYEVTVPARMVSDFVRSVRSVPGTHGRVVRKVYEGEEEQ